MHPYLKLWFLLSFLLATIFVSAQGGNQHDNLNQVLKEFENEIDDSSKLLLITNNIKAICNAENNDTITRLLHHIYKKASANNKENYWLKPMVIKSLITWYAYNKDVDRMETFYDSVTISDKNLSKPDSAQIYTTMANMYIYLGNYPKALEYSFLRQNLSIEADSSLRKYLYRENLELIATLYFKTRLYQEGIKALRIILDETINFWNTDDFTSFYNNMGVFWLKLEEADSALACFQKARNRMIVDTLIKNPIFLSLIEGNMGTAFLMKKKYDTAYVLLNQDLKVSKQTKNYQSVVNVYHTLIDYYLETHQTDNATQALDSASIYLNYLINEKPLLQHYLQKHKVFAALQNIDSANFYLIRHFYIRDSLMKREKDNRLMYMQTMLDIKSKDFKIDLQKNQIEKEKTEARQQKQLRNLLMVCLGIFLIFSAFIWRSRRKQKQTNLVLEQQNKQILQQAEALKETNEKLKTLDEFKKSITGMIVHDLKNPLNTILSFLNSDKEEHKKNITQASNNMLNLVMNILDVNKFEESRLQPETTVTDLIELLSSSIEKVRVSIEEKNLTILTDGIQPLSILADKALIERVLVNLLTNAIRHSPANNEIEIKAVSTDKNMLKICVIDHGQGITHDIKDKVFDKFFTTNKTTSAAASSTGLGLAFCKLAIEAHGGQIGVESDELKGTNFWFTLQKVSDAIIVKHNQQNRIESLKSIVLTDSERNSITKQLNELKQYKHYEITDINACLGQIEDIASENIRKWKEMVILAVKTGNKSLYNKLLNNNL